MLSMSVRSVLPVLLALYLSSTSFAGIEFPFKDGDRVVFWGDSITDNAHYPRTIENYVRGHYPRMKIDFFNLGWGGDAASTRRIERDLPPVKPTLVFISLGMNDGSYSPFSEDTTKRYLSGLENLISVIRSKTQARIILVSPITYETGVQTDERGKQLDKFYPDTLRRMSERLVAFGKEKGIPVIDLNAAYTETIARYKAADPAKKFSFDGIHPGAEGQALMAYLLLKAMGADGDILDLSLDAETRTVLESKNQTVTNIASTKDGLSFTRKVTAFPFRTSGEPLSIDTAPWYDALNRNMITIRNLPAPYYIMKTGDSDQALAILTRDDLSSGVNLSDRGQRLPEDKLAAFIASCVQEKHQERYERWRQMLLKGVKTAYVSTPSRPESSEAHLLAAKADAINTFLESEKLYCPEYELRFIASDTAPTTDILGRPALSVVGGKETIVTGIWAKCGTLQEVGDNARKTYKFDYSTTGSEEPIFGLNLDTWGSEPPVDVSGLDALLISYKGLVGAQKLVVTINPTSGKDDRVSESVEVGGASDAGATVTLPLPKFQKTSFDPTKAATIMFRVTGGGEAGSLTIDSIRYDRAGQK